MSCAPEGPTILVVGCARALAESLERSLSWDPPGEVIAAGSADDLVAVVRDSRPDVVLIDWRHPEILQLARGVGHEGPQPAVVAVDVEPTESEVIALAEAGVSAFVWQDASLPDLDKTLTEVVRGEASCPPTVTGALLRHVAAMARLADPVDEPATAHLTRRETEIALLIDEGLANKEIASRLGIAPQTVKNHVHNLLQKLGARGRNDAAARVLGSTRRRLKRELSAPDRVGGY